MTNHINSISPQSVLEAAATTEESFECQVQPPLGGTGRKAVFRGSFSMMRWSAAACACAALHTPSAVANATPPPFALPDTSVPTARSRDEAPNVTRDPSKNDEVEKGSAERQRLEKAEIAQGGGPNKVVLITGFTAAGVAITGGIVSTILSFNHASTAGDQRDALVRDGGYMACRKPEFLPRCNEVVSSLENQTVFANTAFWAFIIGGTIGAVTGFYALAAPRPKTASAVNVLPIALGKGGGLIVTGEW